jgi:hypothetical protein
VTVEVYRCLSRGRWSVRERGRVVGHRGALCLRDVRFIVSAAGVARIRLRMQREVVAHARGVLVESEAVPAAAVRVRFDPYASGTFTVPDGSPISAAALVWFSPDGSCWAVPHPSECPPCVASSPSSC